MICLNDLVRLQYEPPPIPGSGQPDRRGWIGIVIGVRHSAVSQTIDVLWPQIGETEKWAAGALENVSGAS
jgi:hypothetical protein